MYQSPFKKLSIIVFCIILALILREIVRAESSAVVHYEVITYEEYLTRYEPSKSIVGDFEVEVNEQVEESSELLTVKEPEPETYTITAYCSCEIYCGEWATKRGDGPVIGAYGVELTPWYSVATPLPFGTKLKIDGRTYEVQDTTASWIVDRYAGRIIDIYVGDSHEEALKWGKVEMEVTIFE